MHVVPSRYVDYSKQKGSSVITALVCGAGGFIGHHLLNRLKAQGYWVREADLKHPSFAASEADDFVIGDLCRFESRPPPAATPPTLNESI